MTLHALVRRKTVDLSRIAAEDLVKAAFPEALRVDRGELWTFEVEGAEGESQVRRLLDATTLVVNPNVHRVALGDPPPPASGARVDVVVTDRVDGKPRAVLRSARERLGLRAIVGVRRAIVWSIEAGTPADAERIGLAVAGPGGGLLANPHAQDVERRVVAAAPAA